MSEAFLGEIKIVSFNFAPRFWALCNGQLLPISQNQALFSLLGTTYGGNGTTTFALPNLQGRTPIHFSAGHPLGQSGGSESHSLTPVQLPAHSHPVSGLTVDASSRQPGGGLPAYAHEELYSTEAPQFVAAAPSAVGNTGGAQPHSNMQPYLTLNFVIALAGIFPSRT